MEYSDKQVELAKRSVTSGALKIDWDYVDNDQVTLKIKDGRTALYFWNAGGFNLGSDSILLGTLFADMIVNNDIEAEVLWGPAYKGITLAQSAAMMLKELHDIDVGWAYRRKEAKHHGEKGALIGAPLKDGTRVYMLDDVISSAATKLDEKKFLDEWQKDTCNHLDYVGLGLILDREQKAVIDGKITEGGHMIDKSAAQYFTELTKIPTTSVLGSTDMFKILHENPVERDERLFVNDAFITKFKDYQVEFGTKQLQ